MQHFHKLPFRSLDDYQTRSGASPVILLALRFPVKDHSLSKSGTGISTLWFGTRLRSLLCIGICTLPGLSAIGGDEQNFGVANGEV